MIWVLNEKRSLFGIKRKMKRMSYAQCKPRHPKIKSLKENRLYIEKADKRLMEMWLMPSELSDTLKLDVKMKNRIVFENEDVIIETIEHNHDYIATITNKTAKDLQLGIAEFGLEANWDIEPGGWVGIKADEMGYEILDALEAGNFEYME